MGRIILDPGGGSGAAKGAADADYANESLTSIGAVSPERAIGALLLVMRDQVNAIRADPLTILAAVSVADLVTAMKSKLGQS